MNIREDLAKRLGEFGENCQINVGNTAKAKQGAQGKGLKDECGGGEGMEFQTEGTA